MSIDVCFTGYVMDTYCIIAKTTADDGSRINARKEFLRLAVNKGGSSDQACIDKHLGLVGKLLKALHKVTKGFFLIAHGESAKQALTGTAIGLQRE